MVGSESGKPNISALVDSTSLDLIAQKSIGRINFGDALEKKVRGDYEDIIKPYQEFSFQDRWDDLIGNGSNFDIIMTHNEKSRNFLQDVAPEATSVLVAVYGKEWWNKISHVEISRLKEVASHGHKKDMLSKSILGKLGENQDGRLKMPKDPKSRMELITRTLAYDEERRQVLESVYGLADMIKDVNYPSGVETVQVKKAMMSDLDRRISVAIEKSFDGRKEVRSVLEKRQLTKDQYDIKLEDEVDKIVPNLLDKAQIFSEEEENHLLARLGITRVPGGYTGMSNGRETEGQRAMHLVLQQRVRNGLYKEVDDEVSKILGSDTDESQMLRKEGVDLLLLHCIEGESVTECGRYFQEEVRREILRTKMSELKVIDEHYPPTHQDVSDREIMIGAGRALQEAYFTAEGVLKTFSKMVDSIFTRKLAPGSFLHRVMGTISQGLNQVAGALHESTSVVPRVVPPREKRHLRSKFEMPDYFAEYDR